jgi:hypothetical protein
MTQQRVVGQVEFPAAEPSRPLDSCRGVEYARERACPFDTNQIERLAPEGLGIGDTAVKQSLPCGLGPGSIKLDSERVHQTFDVAPRDIPGRREPHRRCVMQDIIYDRGIHLNVTYRCRSVPQYKTFCVCRYHEARDLYRVQGSGLLFGSINRLVAVVSRPSKRAEPRQKVNWRRQSGDPA